MKPAPPVTRILTARECSRTDLTVGAAPTLGSSGARNSARRWYRLAAVADHQGDVEAVDADLRQADGVLPADHAGVRGDTGDTGDHDAGGPAAFPAAARRRQPVRADPVVRGPTASGGNRAGLRHRR